MKETEAKKLEDIMVSFRRMLIEELRKDLNDTIKCTTVQWEAMRFITDEKEPTMKDIADALSITPPSATSLINHLLQKGLVKRKVDISDRRAIRIIPTQKTQELLQLVSVKKQNIFNTMLMRLTKKQREELINILTILINK
jgi:DNA-binding MarR family transcriptional regulator